MKKTLLISQVLTLLLLCACGGAENFVSADASLEDISAELQLLYPSSDVTRLNSKYMLLLYGLDSAECAECAAFRVARPITPGEVILVHANDEESLSEIRTTLEAYLNQLRETTRDYDAESYAVAEKGRVLTKGLYAVLLCDERQDELEELFLDHMKEYTPGEEPVFTPAPAPVQVTEKPAEPTATPAPEVVPFGLVPESERAEDSWFDDVLLVGNSVLGNMKDYVISRRMGDEPNCMGKAVFMNVNTISYATSVGEIHSKTIPIHLDGLGSCTVEEAINYTGARKVYLTMGYGDLIYYPGDYERTVNNCALLVKNIREQCGEDIRIYIVSVTPRIAAFDNVLGNQNEINGLNAALQAWCENEENGCWFINAAEGLYDETGHLPLDYCVDRYKEGIHLTAAGSQAWVEYLYTHTA